jgi:hypothetical protein
MRTLGRGRTLPQASWPDFPKTSASANEDRRACTMKRAQGVLTESDTVRSKIPSGKNLPNATRKSRVLRISVS